MFVAGVDGCRAGWVWFRVEVPSMDCRVEVVDLETILINRPSELLYLGIDIPIGLLDRSRRCDVAARALLSTPRASSVFSPPCRDAVRAPDYQSACDENCIRTGKKISRQAWGIARKIREVDDAITIAGQTWAFEVHPEVSLWAMNNRSPMRHGKKSREGRLERSEVLRTTFQNIDALIELRPKGVGVDDLLDSAAAAWTAIRLWRGTAQSVSEVESDERNLRASIHY
jgi:predicted RNase H-like nuclease